MQNNKPLVSVIITTRNEENNIERLLKSIKAQTYKKIEIIVVDNNSTDNTKVISKRYTKNIFNLGPERSAQRNLGAKMAKGKFLLFLDADMELMPGVVNGCIQLTQSRGYKTLIIPEKTVGDGLIPKVRHFERNMYMGDLDIEVARFFDKRVFKEFGGYDPNLTGPEDYDLPYRISKKYAIGCSEGYILHHEEGLTLGRLLKKKYYYASKGSYYAKKHPELVWRQGNLLFRRAYLKNWKSFVMNPKIGALFLVVRTLEAVWAVSGFISAVGMKEFIRTIIRK